jgi:lysophospholipase L1-like esterase
MLKIITVVIAAAAAVLGSGTRTTGPERVRPVVTVMGLGDSITAGYQSPNGTGYRTRLRTLLGTVTYVGSLTDPKGGRHEGHGGFEADQLAESAAGWTAAARPRVVLLMAGTNDINHGNTPAQAASDLQLLLSEARRGSPSSTFVLAMIPLIPGKEDQVRDFNARVVSLAKSNGLAFADMQAAVPEGLLVDGLHPGAAGYDAMADAWYAALDGIVARH